MSPPATVTIAVNATNDAPVAAADGYSTNEDQTLNVNADNGVLNNDTDPDAGETLTAVLVERRVERHVDVAAERLVQLRAGGRLQRHRDLHLPSRRRRGA